MVFQGGVVLAHSDMEHLGGGSVFQAGFGAVLEPLDHSLVASAHDSGYFRLIPSADKLLFCADWLAQDYTHTVIIDGLLYLNDFDITYESLLLSSYEKSTGILNGMRIAGFCVGTINSIEVDFVINFYCLRLGYSLPYFQFGTKNYDTKNSSFDISICFISVFIIAIIERKCKKNR